MGKQKIEVLIATKVWDAKPWVDGLKACEHVSKVHVWPTNEDLSQVKALFVWKPLDPGVVDHLPNLSWISSLGAGVDHLVGDEQIPENIPITRIVDPHLTRDMTNYVIMGVMMYQRSMIDQLKNQKDKNWDRIAYRPLKVGILGLGELGAHCAKHLSLLGFETSGLSRTLKQLPGVKTYDSDHLTEFLNDLDVLVNLLPVTPQTESLLDRSFFNDMKKGSFLINVARGNHLVEQDLIDTLDHDRLSGAMLDVFREEPLPQDNPLWGHPKVMITPHVASVTSPTSALQLLYENINRLIDHQALLHQVDRAKGY